MKAIDNILKPLYDLWHKVMDKLSVKNNKILIDGKEVIVKMIVENIKQLSDSQCDELQCGDVVAKKTGNMFHLYQVTYKEDKHGICLTYQAAGLQETQSYDYVEGHWVYNSEDIVNTGGHTDAEVKALAVDAVEEAVSGTVANVIGLDAGGNMVKGSIAGGVKLYKHSLVQQPTHSMDIVIISTVSTPITDRTTGQSVVSNKIAFGNDNIMNVSFSGTTPYSPDPYTMTIQHLNLYATTFDDFIKSKSGQLSGITDTVTEL